MSILRYFSIQCCALIGFFIGVQLLPRYDEIMYPFSPDFSLLWQFYQILFSLGFLSMATALIGSWVYKKTISFAAFTAIVAIVIDYFFGVFSNIAQHYFHFSFVLVYCFGIILCIVILKLLLKVFGTKEHITRN